MVARHLIVLLLISVPAVGQQRPPIAFGMVSKEEMEMTVYDKDSSAAAVILFDVADARAGKFKRHTRIKILKEEGYNQANVLIPIFSEGGILQSTINSLKGSTYNLVNGMQVEAKLESDGRFREEFVEGLNVIRFALPQVKVGSVIEYEYELRSFLRPWQFQHLIPCKWSEYRLSVTEAITFHVQFSGYLAPVINEDTFEDCINSPTRHCKLHRWVMVNVPAFKMEPFISYYRNYTSQVKFDIESLRIPGYTSWIFMSDWSSFRMRYFETAFFDNNVIGSGFLKKTARDLTDNLTHPDEKVKAIYDFVKGKLEWDERNSIVAARDLKKVVEESKGTSADINLILLAMLKHAGLPAEPILSSTIENGFVRQETPISTQFNNVLVLTDYKGKKAILDATDKYLAMEFPRQSCLNDPGYVAGETNFRWVNITEVPKTRQVISLDLRLDADGKMTGSLNRTKTGYEARDARAMIARKGKKEYLSEAFREKAITISDSAAITSLDKINEPLKENYSISISDHAQIAGQVMYIDPMIFEMENSNPFVSETRNYPVDLEFPRETIYTLKLRIPEGYAVDELPSSKLSVLPENSAKFLYSSSVSNDVVTISHQLSLNRRIFSQDEYPLLREFFNIVVSKHKEQIVLKKK